MISRLCGQLLAKTPPVVLVDVNGVGYDVFVPMTTLYQLAEPGEQVILFTHLVVREDAQLLYGFASTSDRELFRTLIKVNGVGPKMALAIMSGMEAAELLQCVRSNNLRALSQIPGIGKKTAERLVIELRDKLAEWEGNATAVTGKPVTTQERVDAAGEAESALVALGYKPAEASRMINAALTAAPRADSEVLIRVALRAALNM